MADMFWGAFPDIEQTIEEVVAEGNKVALRFTMRATHSGNFMGTAPTGKRIEVTGMGLLHIVDGKATIFQEEIDMMGLMEQIGAIPMPE
jgi:predicted ester cyclase